MPVHHVFGEPEASAATRQKIQDSLVLVHGGMAQNVGPILEMVTEHYLLRSEREWEARGEAMQILDQVVDAIGAGDIKRIGEVTTRNFEGPLQTIIPWATNRFTDLLIEKCRRQYGDKFWGFWMLGGMAGGGMGFIFDPDIKPAAQQWLARDHDRHQTGTANLAAVCDGPGRLRFQDQRRRLLGGTRCGRRGVHARSLLRTGAAGTVTNAAAGFVTGHAQRIGAHRPARAEHRRRRRDRRLLLSSVLPSAQTDQTHESSLQQILAENGFDRNQHEQIRTDLLSGRIGLSQNRLSRMPPSMMSVPRT